jgi:hypothetical protein
MLSWGKPHLTYQVRCHLSSGYSPCAETHGDKQAVQGDSPTRNSTAERGNIQGRGQPQGHRATVKNNNSNGKSRCRTSVWGQPLYNCKSQCHRPQATNSDEALITKAACSESVWGQPLDKPQCYAS